MKSTDNSTNTRRARWLLGLSMLMFISACGSDLESLESSEASEASQEPSSAAVESGDAVSEEAEAATSTTTVETTTTAAESTGKEIVHELGTTTLEDIPQRVVVLEYSFIDNLGSLGIAPVGYAVDAMPEYLLPYSEGVGATEVGKRAEPNLESIVALEPDLIIGDLRRHEELYDQLSAIAPTLIFNSLRGSYQDQLDTFEVIAGIFDAEDEAEALLASYGQVFDEAATSTNPDAGEFTIGVLWAEGYTAHSNESFMGSFLEGLGRTNALAPQDGETQYLLDLEGMAAANPSSIVVLCNPADQQLLDDFAAEPVWQALDAVLNDQVYVFDRNLWSKGRGLLAYDQILADAVTSGLLAESASTSASCD